MSLFSNIRSALFGSTAAAVETDRNMPVRLQRMDPLVTRAFRAPRDPNSPAGWYPNSAQEHVPGALGLIRARARDLAQNNPYAARAVSVLSDHTVGNGIRAAIRGDADFESAYKSWSESTDVDHDGRLNLYGLQHLAIRSMFEAGDALIVMRERRVRSGLAMTLQVIDPAQFYDGASPRGAKNRVIGGVEIDQNGKILGYHVRLDLEATESVFIAASDCVHLMEHLYPGQLRGIPRGSQALLHAATANDFLQVALIRARIEACMTAFVTGENLDDGAGIIGEHDPQEQTDHRDPLPERLSPGMIIPLQAGQDVKIAQPPSSGGLLDYMKVSLQAVATAYGVTYAQLSADLEKVNFSSGKTGALEFNRNIDSLRTRSILPAFRRIIDRFRAVHELNTGRRIQASVTLTPPGRETVEPLKDAAANERNIMNGLDSVSNVLRGKGHDPEAFLDEVQREVQMFRERGLLHPLDASRAQGPIEIKVEAEDDEE